MLLKGYDVFPWLMYGQVRRLCLWSCNGITVLAGGLDVLSMFASFSRASMSRGFGERQKATTGCFVRKGYLFREK